MKIALDIDDTIINTYEFLLDRMVEFYKVDKNYLLVNNYSYVNMPEEFKLKETKFIQEMFEHKLNQITIKENAKKNINKLYEQGNEIYLITARQNFKDLYNSTYYQMKNYGIKFTKLICTINKKEACIQNNIDIFIDDSLRNVESVKDFVKRVFIFESSLNKDKKTTISKVKNWDELYSIIKKI